MKRFFISIFVLIFCSCAFAQAGDHPEVTANANYLKSIAALLLKDKSISEARYNKLLKNIGSFSTLYEAYLTKYDAVMSVLPNENEPIGPQEVAKLDEVLKSNPEVGITNFEFTQKFDELIAQLNINIVPILNDGLVNQRSKRTRMLLSDITTESFNKLYEKTQENLKKYDLLLGKHLENTKTKMSKHSELAKGFFKTENYGVEFNDDPSSKVFYVKDEVASLMLLNKEAYLAVVEQSAVKQAQENELAPIKETFEGNTALRAESYVMLKEINDATEAKIKIYSEMTSGSWSSFFVNQGASVASIVTTVVVKDLMMGAVAWASNGELALPSFKEKYYVRDIKGNKVEMDWNNFFSTVKKHYSNFGLYLNLGSFGISAHALNVLWTQKLFGKLDALFTRAAFKFSNKLLGGITGFGLSMGIGSYVGTAFGAVWETRSLFSSGDPVLKEVGLETLQSELVSKQALKENLGSVVISFGFAEAAYALMKFTIDLSKGKVVILPKKYDRAALKKLNDKGYCAPKDIKSWISTYMNSSILTKKPKFFSKVWWKAFFKNLFVKQVPVFTAQEFINDFWVTHWSFVESGKKEHEEQRRKIFLKGVDRYLTLFTYDIFRSESPVHLRAIVDKYRGNAYIGYFIDELTKEQTEYDKTLDLFVLVRSYYRTIVGSNADTDISNEALDAKLKTNLDLQTLLYVVEALFADKDNPDLSKALLYLNGKYGSADNNKKITDAAISNLQGGTTPAEEEQKNIDFMQKTMADTAALSSKIAAAAYVIDSKIDNFELVINNAAANRNLASLISNETLSHYLYNLSLMDAKAASVYSQTLLFKLEAVLPKAKEGTYAARLSAFEFMFQELAPELFGIDHVETINVLDLSAVQKLFREDIFLPLAKSLYAEMKTYTNKDADKDMKALLSDMIKNKDTYGGVPTIQTIAYIYVKAGIPTPSEISIEK